MIFKPTLSETHGTRRLAARKNDELGKAVSSVVINASTESKTKKLVGTTNQPLHRMNDRD